jgi:phosphohistidine phosphatase
VQLLVIRHAIAEDREAFAGTGLDDAQRPITARGERRMRQGVRGLRRVIRRMDLLASSPLVRARQTADIVAARYPRAERVEIPSLAPEADPQDFLEWLVQQAGREVLAAVGHEPSLSGIVTWLVANRKEPVIELKKGAACLVDFPSSVTAGGGVIHWALTPGHLRRIGS